MVKKKLLLEALRASRKKNGQNHPKTFKAIYAIVKAYPYYDGYEERWLSNNEYNMRES